MDGKICQNIKALTLAHIPFSVQLSTWGRLGYKQFLYSLLYVNNLKKFFVSKTKINCFKKMSIFFILIASKDIKIHKIKFEVSFTYKDCI